MRKEFGVGHVVCCRICMVRHYRILTDPTVSKERSGARGNPLEDFRTMSILHGVVLANMQF